MTYAFGNQQTARGLARRVYLAGGIVAVMGVALWLLPQANATETGRFQIGKPLTLSEYNELSRFSNRETVAEPVPGWPKGAGIEYEGPAEQAVLKAGAQLLENSDYRVYEVPEWLEGTVFLRRSFGSLKLRVTEPGVLTVLTLHPQDRFTADEVNNLKKHAFVHVQQPERFQLIGGPSDKRQHTVYQKFMRPGEWLEVGPLSVVVGFEEARRVDRSARNWGADNKGERLYNNIVLPDEWPPRNMDPYAVEPMPVPYLKHRPEVVPIDIGRQLFVDDFLIERTDLLRSFHMPRKYEENPVLRPQTTLETQEWRSQKNPSDKRIPSAWVAAPKSGGVWWDPHDQVFKMWYEASWLNTIALATSRDGINWERPDLDVVPGTNQVLQPGLTPDSWSVIPEWDEDGNLKQWTMYLQPPAYNKQGLILTSPDGIHWTQRVRTNRTSDRSTHFYNPFRSKWVFSLRSEFPAFMRGRQQLNRTRHYYEVEDLLEARWTRLGSLELDKGPLDEKVFWMATDRLDPIDPTTGDAPQMYNFDAVAYESIMLGMFQLHHGPGNSVCRSTGMPKVTELMMAYSRDGFHWDRPDRRVHIAAERKDVWDRGYVQSVASICTILGDKLLIYYIGFAGNAARAGANGMYDGGATGVAFLRRDGFASLDASSSSGTVLTRPLLFSGDRLFVNAAASGGQLRVEVQDIEGNPIEPFTLENSIPFSADSTIETLSWEGGSSLKQLAGRPVRFLFELTNGSLYAFWVSPDESGRSNGYVAGGGPGYTGPIDTVGRLAWERGQRSLREADID